MPSRRIDTLSSANLSPVKLLRLWFVVLLAVLLPLRGAMAASMPCASPGAPVAVSSAAPADHAMHGHDGGHDHGAPSEAHAAHDDDTGAAHDHASPKCSMCSATCSTPPLPSAAVGVPAPAVSAAASFPRLSAPAPTFQSDGQERPPRTL